MSNLLFTMTVFFFINLSSQAFGSSQGVVSKGGGGIADYPETPCRSWNPTSPETDIVACNSTKDAELKSLYFHLGYDHIMNFEEFKYRYFHSHFQGATPDQ